MGALRNVALVTGVLSGPYRLKLVQEKHHTALDHDEPDMFDVRLVLRKGTSGNADKTTPVARHEEPPALPAAVLKPGKEIWTAINDLQIFRAQPPR